MESLALLAHLALAAVQMPLPTTGGSFIRGTESIMRPKAHGTAARAVPPRIRWGCDRALADWCCCFNRHLAEPSGHWKTTQFLAELDRDNPVVFCDSVTSKPLFVAPLGRSLEDFLRESDAHGWREYTLQSSSNFRRPVRRPAWL